MTKTFRRTSRARILQFKKPIPLLNDGASIIALNTSVAGIKGSPNTSAYAATKSGAGGPLRARRQQSWWNAVSA